ncbi:transposase [Burkholderia catarinensis]|uniref:transposase n=1 Tax=Burkholderia catarinensis TaxID=1108140 RepID=UPI0027E3ABC9|nr:transposase [Burkholderia catarinensis]
MHRPGRLTNRDEQRDRLAIDTLGQLLALHATPVNEQDRARAEQLAHAVREMAGRSVALAYVDQGYTGEAARQAAQSHGIE